jgi:5-formyltetrahydrofolate cyclo-ligase
MHSNRFGITEPRPPLKTAPLWTFSVICMPLVAFDSRGNRLGMGGGYYDRSFARFRNSATGKGEALLERPLKLGVAFGFQETPAIAVEAWDIALDAIASDSGYRLTHD